MENNEENQNEQVQIGAIEEDLLLASDVDENERENELLSNLFRNVTRRVPKNRSNSLPRNCSGAVSQKKRRNSIERMSNSRDPRRPETYRPLGQQELRPLNMVNQNVPVRAPINVNNTIEPLTSHTSLPSETDTSQRSGSIRITHAERMRQLREKKAEEIRLINEMRNEREKLRVELSLMREEKALAEKRRIEERRRLGQNLASIPPFRNTNPVTSTLRREVPQWRTEQDRDLRDFSTSFRIPVSVSDNNSNVSNRSTDNRSPIRESIRSPSRRSPVRQNRSPTRENIHSPPHRDNHSPIRRSIRSPPRSENRSPTRVNIRSPLIRDNRSSMQSNHSPFRDSPFRDTRSPVRNRGNANQNNNRPNYRESRWDRRQRSPPRVNFVRSGAFASENTRSTRDHRSVSSSARRTRSPSSHADNNRLSNRNRSRSRNNFGEQTPSYSSSRQDRSSSDVRDLTNVLKTFIEKSMNLSSRSDRSVLNEEQRRYAQLDKNYNAPRLTLRNYSDQEKLSGTANYSNWKKMIDIELGMNKLLPFVQAKGAEGLIDVSPSTRTMLDKSALTYLRAVVSTNVLNTIKSATTAYEAYESLRGQYEYSTIHDKVQLEKRFSDLTFKSGFNKDRFVGDFETLKDELERRGSHFSDHDLAIRFLQKIEGISDSSTPFFSFYNEITQLDPTLVTYDLVKKKFQRVSIWKTDKTEKGKKRSADESGNSNPKKLRDEPKSNQPSTRKSFNAAPPPKSFDPEKSKEKLSRTLREIYTADQLNQISKWTPEEKKKNRCFKCGRFFHQAKDCTNPGKECYICHKFGHEAKDCWHKDAAEKGEDKRN